MVIYNNNILINSSFHFVLFGVFFITTLLMGMACFGLFDYQTPKDENLDKYIQKIKNKHYCKSSLKKRHLSWSDFDNKILTFCTNSTYNTSQLNNNSYGSNFEREFKKIDGYDFCLATYSQGNIELEQKFGNSLKKSKSLKLIHNYKI